MNQIAQAFNTAMQESEDDAPDPRSPARPSTRARATRRKPIGVAHMDPCVCSSVKQPTAHEWRTVGT